MTEGVRQMFWMALTDEGEPLFHASSLHGPVEDIDISCVRSWFDNKSLAEKHFEGRYCQPYSDGKPESVIRSIQLKDGSPSVVLPKGKSSVCLSDEGCGQMVDWVADLPGEPSLQKHPEHHPESKPARRKGPRARPKSPREGRVLFTMSFDAQVSHWAPTKDKRRDTAGDRSGD
jgi:hypothetical protein